MGREGRSEEANKSRCTWYPLIHRHNRVSVNVHISGGGKEFLADFASLPLTVVACDFIGILNKFIL
jgi:hypothetical protein